jgi:hypothetical protein
MPQFSDSHEPRVASWRHVDATSETTPYRRLGRRLAPLVIRFPRRYGLFELAALGSTEWMRRHLAIINELEGMRRDAGRVSLRVIDFGGADGSLGRAIRIYGLERHYRIVTADIEQPETVAQFPPHTGFLLLDPDGDLPVRAGEFDVAVSSDVFEHIPNSARRHWAHELDRVASLGQVHSVPADSSDGRWASTKADQEFARWYEETFGEPERWTTEHLAIGAPLIEDLRSIFPAATVSGIVSCRVWQVTMRAKYGPKGPLDRLRFATNYAAGLRAIEQRPPYKNALLVIRR